MKKAWFQTQTREGNDNLTRKHMKLRQLQLLGMAIEDFGKEHIIRTITKHGGRSKYKECLHSKIKSHVYRRMHAITANVATRPSGDRIKSREYIREIA